MIYKLLRYRTVRFLYTGLDRYNTQQFNRETPDANELGEKGATFKER